MTDSIEAFTTADFPKRRGCCALAATSLLVGVLSTPAVALAQGTQASGGGAVQAPAQPAQPPSSGAASASPAHSLFPPQPAPAEGPGGFVYAFGRWWDSTRGKFEDLAKQPNDPAHAAAAAGHDAMQGAAEATKGAATATQNALKDAAEATKDAATSLFRLPGVRVVEVHQRCAIAPNGAPDCQSAATNVCRAKGFSDGHPVGVQSSENCPPAVWMSGRQPVPGECPEETVVLMVACQ